MYEVKQAKCQFRVGQKVSYCYDHDYIAHGGGDFKVVSKQVPLNCFPRYTITNGTIHVSGVREKDLACRS